jgi:hypothetical protein
MTSQLTEYALNDDIYIDIKQLIPLRPYAKGCTSIPKLIARKGYQDVIYGHIKDGNLIQTQVQSKKYGSVFVNKKELVELFNGKTPEIPPAPPVLEADDLVFFKDKNGVSYQVEMRGDRTEEGIYFKVKDLSEVFQMSRLDTILQSNQSVYVDTRDYQWFRVDSNGTSRTLYLTFIGLLKVINSSYILNCNQAFGHIYLIKLGSDNNNKRKCLYKFGKSWNVDLRALQHKRYFAKFGFSDIELLYTARIDVASLSEAELMIKRYLQKANLYRQTHFSNELCELTDDEVNALIQYYLNLENTMSSTQAVDPVKYFINQFRSTNVTNAFNAMFGNQEQQLESMAQQLDVNVDNLDSIMKYKDRSIVQEYQSQLELQSSSYELKLSETKRKCERSLNAKELQLQLALKDLEIKDREMELLRFRINELERWLN